MLDRRKVLTSCPTDSQRSIKTKRCASTRKGFEGVMSRKEIKLDLTSLQSETPQRLLFHLALSPNSLVRSSLAEGCLVQQVRRDKAHELGLEPPSGVKLLAQNNEQSDTSKPYDVVAIQHERHENFVDAGDVLYERLDSGAGQQSKRSVASQDST